VVRGGTVAAVLFVGSLFMACSDVGDVTFDIDPPERQTLDTRTRDFDVLVELGCDDRDEVSGYEVDYEADRVIVTFEGTIHDDGTDCGSSAPAHVELDEALGPRLLCDGGGDIPIVEWAPVPFKDWPDSCP
jgi:hypothetical protein